MAAAKKKKPPAKPVKKPAKKNKPVPAKKKSAPAKKKPAPAKPAAKKAVKKTAVRKPVAARSRASIATPARVMTRRVGGKSEVVGLVGSVTMEDIALKAYYLAERRINSGLPGDSESDWLQAERELRG